MIGLKINDLRRGITFEVIFDSANDMNGFLSNYNPDSLDILEIGDRIDVENLEIK